MKMFDYGFSVNFIDEDDVFLGYRLEQSCCEKAGYGLFWDGNCRKKIDYDNDNELNEILEGYYFDVKFMRKYYDGKNTDTNYALFRIKKDGEKNIYISLSNKHNGYYAHGFELAKVDRSNFDFEDDEETSGDVDEYGEYEVVTARDYYSEEYNAELAKYLINDAPRIQYFFKNHI